jgi:hypothetical protein
MVIADDCGLGAAHLEAIGLVPIPEQVARNRTSAVARPGRVAVTYCQEIALWLAYVGYS